MPHVGLPDVKIGVSPLNLHAYSSGKLSLAG